MNLSLLTICYATFLIFLYPATKLGGAYSFTLVRTYVRTYVTRSSTVLVSATSPLVFDAEI